MARPSGISRDGRSHGDGQRTLALPRTGQIRHLPRTASGISCVHGLLHEIPIGPLAEALDQEINEEADLYREVSVGRVDGVEREFGRLVVGQYRAQGAC